MSKVTLRVTRYGETHTRVLIDPQPEHVMGYCADRVTYRVEGEVDPRVMEVLEGCYEPAKEHIMKLFPIHSQASSEAQELNVPWEMIAQHEAQAVSNHGQTLKRLAERDGCCATEILSILTDQRLWPLTPEPEAIDKVNRLIEEWNMNKIIARAIEIMADIEHDRWAGWYVYQRDHSDKPDNIARWDRLASTPYSQLDDFVQEKDRDEVRKTIAALSEAGLVIVPREQLNERKVGNVST